MKFRNNISVDEYVAGALEVIEADVVMVKVLNQILMDKDLYSHSQGVARVTTQLAISLNLDEEDIKHLVVTALLHDAGKCNIPKAILYKTGKLSEEDIIMIRKHPVDGYKMLKGSSLPEEFLQVVLCHHETLDGTGYPDGISHVSYFTQIVTVADIFSALTEVRCYRSTLSISDALDYMSRISNINQDIVNVLDEVIEDS